MARKKTHEEFIAEVKERVGDEYTVLGQYVNADTKIMIRHNSSQCENNEHLFVPYQFLGSGYRCPICRKKEQNLKQTKTHKQFVQEVHELVGDEFTVISTYNGSTEDIGIRHSSDLCENHEFKIMASKFLSSKKCPRCKEISKAKANHEKFLGRVKELLGDDYVVIGQYVDSHTRVLIRHNCELCDNHEYLADTNPSRLVNGCPRCNVINKGRNLAKSHEQFVQEVYDLVGDEYIILGRYIRNSDSIKIKHNKCGRSSMVKPANFLNRGGGCIHCKQGRISHRKFVRDMYDRYGCEYSVLSYFNTVNDRVTVKHNVCGNTYETFPLGILDGQGCRKCYIESKRLTTEQFKEKVYKLVGEEYEVLGEYQNNNKKIKMRHNKCDREYNVYPSNFLSGKRCVECVGNVMKTTEQFKQEVHELVQDEYMVVSEYTGASKRILMKHNECNTVYKVKPSNFLNGRRCPRCSSSEGEKRIAKWLDESCYKYKREATFNNCRDKNKLPFDFLLTIGEKAVLVEFDGRQHFLLEDNWGGEDRFIRGQLHDQIKNKYCISNNIPLLRIKYTALHVTEQLVEKFLNNTLSLNNTILEDYYDNDKDCQYVVIGLSTSEKTVRKEEQLCLALS
ncbi:hypothetical protein [Bacillus cereus]|uniref:hypothetical protein n=1 Tax=Bacillus cereus TaxID=1396 RepID=UPI000BFB838C|nr:hypothetical protein [Bacillus cereus]PGW27102.1 hypothetical protein COD88_14790 [Bacillus cereus]